MALDRSSPERVDEQESRSAILKQIDLDLIAVEEALAQRRRSLAEIEKKLRALQPQDCRWGALAGGAGGDAPAAAQAPRARAADEEVSSFAEWLHEHEEFCSRLQFPSGAAQRRDRAPRRWKPGQEGKAQEAATGAPGPPGPALRRTPSAASTSQTGSVRCSTQHAERSPTLHRSHSWSVSRSAPSPAAAAAVGGGAQPSPAPTPSTPSRRCAAACYSPVQASQAQLRSPHRLGRQLLSPATPQAHSPAFGRLQSPPASGRLAGAGPPPVQACKTSLYSPPPRSGSVVQLAPSAGPPAAPAPAPAPACRRAASASPSREVRPAAEAGTGPPPVEAAALPPAAGASAAPASPVPACGGGAGLAVGSSAVPSLGFALAASQRWGAESREPSSGPRVQGAACPVSAPGALAAPVALALPGVPVPAPAALSVPGGPLAPMLQTGIPTCVDPVNRSAVASMAAATLPSMPMPPGATPFVFYKDGYGGLPGPPRQGGVDTPMRHASAADGQRHPWAPGVAQGRPPADPPAAAGAPERPQPRLPEPVPRPPEPVRPPEPCAGRGPEPTPARSFSEVNLGSFAEGLEQWRPPSTGSFHARTEATFRPAAANGPGGPNATYTGPQPLPRGQPQCPTQ